MNWPAPQPKRPTFAEELRRYWWAPIVFLGLAVAVVVSGVDFSDDEPDIHPALRSQIDRLERLGDCTELQATFDRSDAADELRYIDDALDAAGCYD